MSQNGITLMPMKLGSQRICYWCGQLYIELSLPTKIRKTYLNTFWGKLAMSLRQNTLWMLERGSFDLWGTKLWQRHQLIPNGINPCFPLPVCPSVLFFHFVSAYRGNKLLSPAGRVWRWCTIYFLMENCELWDQLVGVKWLSGQVGVLRHVVMRFCYCPLFHVTQFFGSSLVAPESPANLPPA